MCHSQPLLAEFYLTALFSSRLVMMNASMKGMRIATRHALLYHHIIVESCSKKINNRCYPFVFRDNNHAYLFSFIVYLLSHVYLLIYMFILLLIFCVFAEFNNLATL